LLFSLWLLEVVVLFLMRGWSHIFTIKGNIEIFNFIKGGKFDILLAPHYNTVKKM
jgi:hypothetical protein